MQKYRGDFREHHHDHQYKDLDADEWQKAFEDVGQRDVWRCHGFQIERRRSKRWAEKADLHVDTEPVSYTHLTLPTIYSV